MSKNGDELRDRKRSFIMYFDYAEDFEDLSDEELGRVIRALFSFLMYGEEAAFEDRVLRHIYNMMVRQAVRDIEKYHERCNTNRQNAQQARKTENSEGQGSGSGKFNPDDAAGMVYDRIHGR